MFQGQAPPFSTISRPYLQVLFKKNIALFPRFAAISKMKMYGPFFFMERTITKRTSLDMLENWLMSQVNEDIDDYVFQQRWLSGLFS